MSFMITPTFAETMRDMVRAQPLAPGELRRISGLDGMVLALPDTLAGDDYMELFRVRIDGVLHVIYTRTAH